MEKIKKWVKTQIKKLDRPDNAQLFLGVIYTIGLYFAIKRRFYS